MGRIMWWPEGGEKVAWEELVFTGVAGAKWQGKELDTQKKGEVQERAKISLSAPKMNLVSNYM